MLLALVGRAEWAVVAAAAAAAAVAAAAPPFAPAVVPWLVVAIAVRILERKCRVSVPRQQVASEFAESVLAWAFRRLVPRVWEWRMSLAEARLAGDLGVGDLVRPW